MGTDFSAGAQRRSAGAPVSERAFSAAAEVPALGSEHITGCQPRRFLPRVAEELQSGGIDGRVTALEIVDVNEIDGIVEQLAERAVEVRLRFGAFPNRLSRVINRSRFYQDHRAESGSQGTTEKSYLVRITTSADCTLSVVAALPRRLREHTQLS